MTALKCAKRSLEIFKISIQEDQTIINLVVNENDLLNWKVTIKPFPTEDSTYDVQITFPRN